MKDKKKVEENLFFEWKSFIKNIAVKKEKKLDKNEIFFMLNHVYEGK